MKKVLTTIWVLLSIGLWLSGQSTDPQASKCISSAGTDAKYLKDYRIQLGQAAEQEDLRYHANISLWKDMKYRFSMCCTEDSKNQLILKIKDETNKVVFLSYDQKTGKAYTSIDFTCNKSGIYQLSYDFTNDHQGSGFGVVSLVK